MYYCVTFVEPREDGTPSLEFENGTRRVYDMKPHMESGVFEALADPRVFRSARTDGVSVTWPGDLDIAPEELYRNCVEIEAPRAA